ncbi:[NiFe] hydrogenase metallocenter assembly protein HypE [hydrothermal vent metagenome]|uniref:[NiFe] hydrogenase metallocenter assembly protein HypE n=1 Tax=hydrothermal vent metagenome TaxID=652676 RepID=A0A3B0VI09_9ZZZZ
MTENINLDHGSGGLASEELITGLMKPLSNPALDDMEDCAIIDTGVGRLAFSTDSYVVEPIFFPGGSIGKLAVHGTINDLAMRGARPMGLSLGLILEEGLDMAELRRVNLDIAEACAQAGVPILTGDTKVVPRGKADKIFINTAGIGQVAAGLNLGARNARPGDRILISGSMADHGITIMLARHNLPFSGNLQSDTQALHRLTAALTQSIGPGLHAMRDPTRGGVGTTLCEIAARAGVAMTIDESAIPIHPQVRVACELLGLDPLYLANEGKFLALVTENEADNALKIIRQFPEGHEAAIIGEVRDSPAGRVEMRTTAGGRRLITALSGEPLPRIC